MYSLNMPVSALRTKMRQEFERHRYVNQLNVVDMLLFQSHAEFQVRSNVLLSKGIHRWILGLIWIIWGTAPEVMERASSPDELSRSHHDRWRGSRPSGNVELLEAITAYSQILPRKRRFRGETASKFYATFLRSTAILIPSLTYANYFTTAGSKLIFYLRGWFFCLWNTRDTYKRVLLIMSSKHTICICKPMARS